ncbi:MAG TPA: hypothetical protein VIZ69_01690 [Thermoanaerobaculia bacterium]
MRYDPTTNTQGMLAIALLLRAAFVHCPSHDRFSEVTQLNLFDSPGERHELIAADRRRPPSGRWGGEHVRLDVTETGAQMELDCAHGSIENPITVDETGRFTIRGAFVREHPGPIRPGLERRAQPAVYSGRIDGKTMKLSIELPETGETVGTYSLVHGEEGRVRKCR